LKQGHSPHSLARGRDVIRVTVPKRGRLYHGVRDADGNGIVWVVPLKCDAYPLPARHDLRNHSPTGVEWGYAGSGPAQLALALLAHVAGDEVAQDWYQAFKEDVVAGLSHDTWELSEDTIEAWLEARMRREGL
jgi:hypothetical protein